MKKSLFATIVALFFLTVTNAQESTFGITAGFNSLTSRISFDGESLSSSESGFFVGLFSEFVTGEFTSFQPQINYATVFVEEERLNELIIPLMLKYYPSEKLYLQAGPQFDYILDDDADDVNKLGVSVGFGIGYDINKSIFLSARYAIGLNNRIKTEDDIFFEFDTDLKSYFNNFQVGLGIRF
jgi:opacity protein-like surface antigen